jgi:DNA-binding NarL/FixJ family response regulator/multidrug resistance efflux pump
MIHLLIVDDQESIRTLIKFSLAPQPDFEIVGTANDGYSAIEQIEKLHPDVVLMDLEMPRLDGIAATQRIAERFADIQVLILSLYDEPDYIAQAIGAGARGYLLKTASVEELQQAIRNVYKGYRHIGTGILEKILPQSFPAQSAIVSSQELMTKNGSSSSSKLASLPFSDTDTPQVFEKKENSLDAPIREIGWRQVLILLIGAISLSLGIYLVRQFLRQPLPSLSSLQQIASFVDTEFTGKIKPASTFKIAAVAPSLVENIYVKIGQRVKAGQVLLSVKNLEAQKAIEQQKQLQQATLQQQQIAQQQRQTAQQQISFLEQQIAALKHRATSLNTEVAAAEMGLVKIQSQMDGLPLPQRQFSVERTQAIYERAFSRVERYTELQEEGAITKDQLEQAQADLKVAQTDFEVAKKAARIVTQLEQAKQKQSRLQRQVISQEQQEKIKQLEGELNTARLDYTQATERLKQLQRQASQSFNQQLPQLKTSIQASRDGVIIGLPVTGGDQIFTGNSLIELAQLSNLHVEVAVNARLINALHTGQSVLVKVGTGKNAQKFNGKIVLINPLPNQELNHIVEIQFKNSSNALLVGQLASVQFFPQ